MITPWCTVGRHAVTDDQTFRLVGAACTQPPQPMGGFPRGTEYRSVPWYPHEGGPSSIVICSEHDTGAWAAAPTSIAQ